DRSAAGCPGAVPRARAGAREGCFPCCKLSFRSAARMLGSPGASVRRERLWSLLHAAERPSFERAADLHHPAALLAQGRVVQAETCAKWRPRDGPRPKILESFDRLRVRCGFFPRSPWLGSLRAPRASRAPRSFPSRREVGVKLRVAPAARAAVRCRRPAA